MPTTPAASKRPRIVHVYKDVYPPVQGGIERILALMAAGSRPEFEVSVLVASRSRAGSQRILPDTEGDDPVIVTEVPSLGRALSAPLAPGFPAALRRSGADLFHFHVPHPTGEMAFLLAGGGVPAVATYHSDVVRQKAAMTVYNMFFQRFLARMRVIMPTSRRYMESSAQLARHLDRCRVVPLGYPLENYAPTPAIETRAAQLRAQHGEFVLFLGCLREYKGLRFLLEALALQPGVCAVIAGEGRMGDELRARAAHLGLADRVVFTGLVSDDEAVALLHAASLFVLPAHQRSEAFGLCQIEAMACGLPVISTDLPTGVPEVNRHGETGLIVPPADAPALAAAIGELMGDPARRAAMSEAGRARAHQNYTTMRMVEDIKSVYREVLEDAQHRPDL